jgi:hypothetical protein
VRQEFNPAACEQPSNKQIIHVPPPAIQQIVLDAIGFGCDSRSAINGFDRMSLSKGQGGNPGDRARGARNKATLALEAMFDAQAEELVHAIIDRAVGGHPAAMRLCLERALPVGRGRPLPIRLPPLENPEDMRKAIAEISAAFGAGTITIREAAMLLGAFEGHMGHIPAIETLRKAARVEADLAKAAAALGIDRFITISEGPQAARAAAVAAAGKSDAPADPPGDARRTP